MAKYTMGESIIISVVLGSILLLFLGYLFGISGILILIVMGFIATYITTRDQRNYKIGGITGVFIGIILFIFSFLTPPQLPYNLDFNAGFAIGGLFNLGLFFIVSMFIFFIFGSIGGLIAIKLRGEKTEDKKKTYKRTKSPQTRYMPAPGFKERPRRKINSRKTKKPKRTLKRSK